MNLSFYTVKDNLDTTRGYGTAGFNMVRSMQELGHRVRFDNPDSPVQISFCQPSWYKFHDGQYRIGYTPWESTELPHGWVDYFNNVDEVWATSQWVANVYEQQGVKKPIHVYEHGLESVWQPHKRKTGDVIKFLHVGEPAVRKGGQMALDAFRAAFGDRKDVHLTMKCYFQHYLRAWRDGEHILADRAYDNVTINTEMMAPQDLHRLFLDHDVLVYPTYGEGFGFIPLQALGTGMPVISTFEWAPYEKFIMLGVHGRWDRSIWSVHPGRVLYPDFEDLVYWMRHTASNIDAYHKIHYQQAPAVHEAFNWRTKTEKILSHLVENS